MAVPKNLLEPRASVAFDLRDRALADDRWQGMIHGP